MKSLLPVGRVSKTFGPGGELVINLYDTFPDNIKIEEPLYIVVDMLAVPLFLEKFTKKGRKSAVVLFSDIDTAGRAAEFLGKEINLPAGKATVREPRGDEELFFDDLAGFEASITEQNGEGKSGKSIRGRIDSYLDSELNPLFVVISDGKEIYLPANEDLIEEIDIESGSVSFLIPEGLLSLYLD